MNKMKPLWTSLLLLCASAAAGHAQVAEFGIAGGVSRLSDKTLTPGYSPEYGLDDGFSLAFRITINNWNYFGNEFGYNYNRSKLLVDGADNGGMAIHQGFYDFLAYATPEGKRIRPFVAGGGQFSNFVPPGASASYGQGSNKFGYNYGGGVKVRVGEKWMVRFDYRRYVSGKPFGDSLPVSGSLKQDQITAGFSLVL